MKSRMRRCVSILTEPGRSRRDARAHNDIPGGRQASFRARRRGARAPRRHIASSWGESGRPRAGADASTTGRRVPPGAKGLWSRDAQGSEDFPQAQHHMRGSFCAERRPDQYIDRPKRALLQAKRLSHAALDAIARRSARRVLARHQQPQPGTTCVALLHIDRITGHLLSPTLAQQTFELRFLREAPGRTEPEAFAGRGYSPSRRRPRARRLRSTARPPRVALRTRNPWRRARRVFEGWYVRLVAMAGPKKGGIRARASLRCQIAARLPVRAPRAMSAVDNPPPRR